MSQATKGATVTTATSLKPRIARRIIRNYLRATLVAACEPSAVSAATLARVEVQLNRVPGYKLAKGVKVS